MKKLLTIIVFNSLFCFSQKTIDEVLKKNNDNSIEYLKPIEVSSKKKLIYLDAREKNEFETSHLEKSIYIGFNDFNSKRFTDLNIDKNTPILVYCSLGVRSEKIAKKIKKLGYKNIFNLYGGIFLWKNEGFKVYDSNDKETENVHAFSKSWSIYLKKGTKIY